MLTPGPVGVGTRFRETRIVFGREATETMEVLAFDPPRGYVLETLSCGVRYRTEMRLAPRPGGTDVAMTLDLTPLTRLAKIMSLVMRPMVKSMAKVCAEDLAGIKASFEASQAAPV